MKNINNKKFYILRGAPGSGKSFLAKQLAGEKGKICSADDYHIDENGNYNWKPEKIGTAHDWCQNLAINALVTDIPIIIIDNTNTTLKEMSSYIPHINLARGKGYDVEIIEPNTDWAWDIDELENRNTHNVPRFAIKKMLNRYVKNVTVEKILDYK